MEQYSISTSKRLANTIFVSQSITSAGRIAIITLLSIVAVDLSGKETLAGTPLSLSTLAQAFAAFPFGILMGRFGRRFGLTLGYGTTAFGAIFGLIAIIQNSFPLLLIGSMLLGIGRAGEEQSRFAAGDLFPESMRARMIGRVVFAGTIGAILGPLLVGPSEAIALQFGIPSNAGPWLVAVLFMGLASLITFLLLRPEPSEIAKQIADIEEEAENQKKIERNESTAPVETRPLSELIKLPDVRLAIFSMVISQAVMVALMVITPLHMNHSGHDNAAVSLVISAHTLGMYGLSWLTGRLVDQYGRITMMVAGAVILLVSAVMAPLSTALPVLVISLFLLGLGWNFGYVAGTTLLSDALRGKERTTMQGANDMIVAGVASLGGFSSGVFFDWGGYTMVAGVGLVMVLLFLWIIRLLSPRIQFASIKPSLGD